ncbi:response regulator [Dechloromonas denitrificans]|uniref:ATP-binding response regulator n=1 Tax=Dechloromonas denitrificans TaxID=281362 RepID=UPI001CF83289|nr:response regulator [Dechloromonas denitrificans]UCV12042.1 response regulator [Dechloromonas denitrificans]
MSDVRILIVDDEALNLEILTEYFEAEPSFSVRAANSGEAAWALLQEPDSRFNVILLDRMMPGMDGIALLRYIKADPRLAGTPIILQTAAISAGQIREGLEAGAYYYLTKPYRRDALLAIVHAALAEAEGHESLRQALNQHINTLQFLDRGEFSIRTIEEAGQLASFIAQACPNPDNAVLGISELLVNGVEHGNLGLSYEEKSELKRTDGWKAEIERRSTLPENRDKRVTLNFQRDSSGITLTVSDQGKGFPWQNFLEIDPSRAFDPNGRGIALARLLSFSSIQYQGCGNVAIATIACSNNEN